MKNIITLVLLVMTLGITQSINAQHLLGKVTLDSFAKAPFNEWYKKGFEQYHPTPSVMAQFKNNNYKKLKYQLFFGSWCGDSKREVPRMLELMDSLGISKENIEIIGTDNNGTETKKSPTGEEQGKNIFRVPTLIVYKNNVELNRIIEFPSSSLENDLLSIVKEEAYSPNYLPLTDVAKWLDNGLLINENTSIAGLANIVRPKIDTDYTLNAASKLLFTQGKKTEAIKLAKINYLLFPEKYVVLKTLGDLLLQNDEKVEATKYLETALRIVPKEEFDACLNQLYKAKGIAN